MVRSGFAALLLIAALGTNAFAQAVTQWRTPDGLPVAIVEVPGGDVEHVGAIVPLDAPVPKALGGFPVSSDAVPEGRLWITTVPALVAGAVLREAETALATSGASAVVLLGPAPSRELLAGPAPFGAVPYRPAARPSCLLAEGETEIRRGAPERLELVLPVPDPADPRFDLLPALEGLVRLRLAKRWPEVSTGLESREGCERLIVRLPAPNEHPWELLAPLRAKLGEIVATPPSIAEVTDVSTLLARRVARWAVDGLGATRSLVERLAVGGSAAAALAPPALDADALAELVRGVLARHAGRAVIYEQERRATSEPPAALPNGVLLSWRWIAARIGVVAVALGGMQPGPAAGVLQGVATDAARSGWQVRLASIAGVLGVAVAVPADDLTTALETIADAIHQPPPAAPSGWPEQVAGRLGLGATLSAESVSLSVALPPEADEAKEAAAKFFSDLSPGGVRSSVPLAGAGLSWTHTEGPPVVTAVVDVPTTAAGWVAGQVLVDRLTPQEGVQIRWLNLPGRLVLEVTGRGEGHVPGLDEHLGETWKKATAAVDDTQVRAAVAALTDTLFGDTAQATLRTAAAPFLPAVPRQEELLGVETKEVTGVLRGLPAWAGLPRMAQGAAPLVVVPPQGPPRVRKSPPRRPH